MKLAPPWLPLITALIKGGGILMRVAVIASAICLSAVGLVCAENAHASIPQPTEIPAQSLASALQVLAKDRDLQVLYRTEVVGRLRCKGIAGDLTTEQALKKLLEGTGLEFRYLDENTVMIVPVMATEPAVGTSDAQPENSQSAEPSTNGSSNGAAESSASGQQLQEVTVTGSRLSAGFAAPTPVTVISAEQLQQTSPNDLAAALAQAPSLMTSTLTANAGNASATAATNGQSLLNLRGLGVNRTLVLLDGQRLGTTNVQDSVDINVIPQMLVKRVDVVTGGASATYGSDAVAGVVNFVLDTTFEGFKADVNAGITTYGDAPNGSVSVAFGHAFGDNVRLIASGAVFKTGGVGLPPTGRGWDDNPYAAWPNPTTGALPSTLVEPDARSSNATYGGLITAVQGCTSSACKALVNQQFGANGALEPFAQGAYPGSSFASGGDGAYVIQGISPQEDRENAFFHAEWDVHPGLTLFGEGLFSRTYTSLAGHPYYEDGQYAFTIYPNNAYLPASLAAVFAANPTLASFTMGRMSADIGDVYDNSLDEVGRISIGAKGAINDRWSFDTSIAQQYTVDNLDITNTINRNIYAAADAVVNPANGQIVCRSTLQGYDPGCVPINLFGPGPVNPAAIAYVSGVNRGDTVFRQTAFESNVRGDLGDRLNFGAGAISVALGVAFHHDIADRHVDSLSDTTTSCVGLRGCPAGYNGSYGGYQFYNPTPLYGWTSATEGYAEVGVPLLSDAPLVKSLNVDLAGRLTDYSISSFQGSWKLGLQWALNDSFLLRGTSSQDVRAPDVLELFNKGTAQIAKNLFPSSSAVTQYQVQGTNFTVGNPDLDPEIAHTITAGMVLSPTWTPGWQTSLDYYHILLTNAIESLLPQSIVNGCNQGNQTDCHLISVQGVPLTSTSGITATTAGMVVTAPTQNVGIYTSAGIDFDSTYVHQVGGGNLTARLLANYLLQADVPTAVTSCASSNVTGSIGGCGGGFPQWTGSASLQYQLARVGAYVQERYIGAGVGKTAQIIGVTINRDHVPAIMYTDLNLNYAVGFDGRGKVYLNVTNLFNRDPPVTTTSSSAWVMPTDYALYDVLGRRFLLGYRISL